MAFNEVGTWLPILCSVVTTCMTVYYMHSLHMKQYDSVQKRQIKKDIQKVKLKVNSLSKEEVPLVLRPSYYFTHRDEFKHYDLFETTTNVFDVLDGIHTYCERWLEGYPSNGIEIIKDCQVGRVKLLCPDIAVVNSCTLLNYASKESRRLIIEENVRIMGGVLDVTDGSIFIGKNVVVEPNVYIKGPAIVGVGTVLRHGAYLRGDTIIGKECVIRCEMKHSIVMDKAELGHPGYCGDSICGYKSHFANQVSTANLPLLSSKNISVEVNGVIYDTGRRKIGVILGDYSQLGCNTATDPCTLVGLNTAVYPVTRLNKGFYGPNEIIKNKPMEHGVIERTQLRVA